MKCLLPQPVESSIEPFRVLIIATEELSMTSVCCQEDKQECQKAVSFCFSFLVDRETDRRRERERNPRIRGGGVVGNGGKREIGGKRKRNDPLKVNLR